MELTQFGLLASVSEASDRMQPPSHNNLARYSVVTVIESCADRTECYKQLFFFFFNKLNLKKKKKEEEEEKEKEEVIGEPREDVSHQN